MHTFFAASRYRNGPVAASLALAYLAVVGVLVGGAAVEGTADGAFMGGLALLATLPSSIGVMAAYSVVETARGVPLADQDGGGWTLVGFAGCALVNALLVWVILRGHRVRHELERAELR